MAPLTSRVRNIFLFIRRYSTFFIFLILQGVALWFLFSYNRYHRARFLGMANEMTGRINSQYNRVEDYFHLKEENKRVHRLNDSLMNLLRAGFEKRDTSLKYYADTVAFDTTGLYRRYYFRPAAVVYSTVNFEKNYIQINRGTAQGINDGDGVLSSDGAVVGVVVNTSANFSQVLSLLHLQSKLVVSLKKAPVTGDLLWDGRDARFLTLRGMPKMLPVAVGDTVVTSEYNSMSFPRGLMVGTVSSVKEDAASGTYQLKIKAAANFFGLQQVHVIANLDRPEQQQLLDDTRAKIEQQKKNPK